MEKEEFIEKLFKSMYKAVKSSLDRKNQTRNIVEDILDEDHVAEIDQDEVQNTKKVSVIRKNNDKHLNLHKNIIKLRNIKK